MRTIASLLVIVAVVYLGLCAWVYATQRAQIYFPTPPSHAAGARAMWLEAQGARLKVWVVPRPGPRALLYFGGNAEDVAGNIAVFSATFPDHSLYFLNYRGYGGSTGQPTEAALQSDALAVYDHVRARHSAVAVMGRSLGSGVAVCVASERPVAGLVLVTAYDSLVNVARAHFRWLPVGLLLQDRYNSASRAREVKAPVLVVIAGDDEIIPRARSEALVAAFAAGQVRVKVIDGATHNTLDLSPAYLEAVRAFVAAAPAGGSASGMQ
jgi:pimeloyl-ACP methyl ester carboxylesterase